MSSYSQGFKSGGFDMRGNASAPFRRRAMATIRKRRTTTRPESSRRCSTDTLQLNLTAFYTPYEDVQITTQEFQIVNGVPTNVTAVLNAGKQLNQGVELETLWRPVAGADPGAQRRLARCGVRRIPLGLHPPPQPQLPAVDLSSLQYADQCARVDDVPRRNV